MKKIELMIVVVAMVLLAACDDFIDTVPKGKVIPTTMDDFKSMIIDVTASSVAIQWQMSVRMMFSTQT